MSGVSSAAERHLGALLFRRAQELGERVFIKVQRGRRVEEVSWRAFGARVAETLLGLHALGLRKGERVGILAQNRLEWLFADAATLAGGLPSVVVAPQLSDAKILRILGHSQCRAVFVEDEIGAGRIINLKGHLPDLSHMIVMEEPSSALPHSLSFADLLARGRAEEQERIGKVLESIHPDDLATIMYTSGSTGEPKGVMRTQRNLLANVALGREITLSDPDELSVIVLSLNHLYGRYGFYKSLATGRTTAIIEETELDVDLDVIRALAPTAMSLVPRVMERIWARILEEEGAAERWERVEALKRIEAEKGPLSPTETREYQRLAGSLGEASKRLLGGRIKYISYGGAPMPSRILCFFEVVGIPLLGSYGSTECGGVTLSGIRENRPGNLGRPFPNVEVRIAEDGEILVRGPSVTPGYFGDPEATREVLDPDGWFHSGDLGEMEPDGSLRIVGRKKDLFYCMDGSSIYPAFIEILLENNPYIRQAILLGDRRPFIAALLVPERERIAAELKKDVGSLGEAELRDVLWSRVEGINVGLEHYEKIRKIAVILEDFPEKARSVTAFQKVKVDRKAVEDLYRQEIERIYGRG